MRRLFRILLRTVLVLVVLLVVAAAGAYWFREELFADRIAREIEAQLASRLGGRWSVGKIEGGWLNDIAIVGLRTLEAPPSGALVRLDCGRAAARYDWRGLLGDAPLAAVESIDISNAVVELDLTRPSPPPDPEAEPFDPRDIPTQLPRLAVQGRVTVRTEEGDMVATGIRIESSGTVAWTVEAEVALPEAYGPGGRLRGALFRLEGGALEWRSDTPFAGVLVRAASRAVDGSVEASLEVAGGAIDASFAGGRLRGTARAIDLARLPRWLPVPEPRPAGLVDATFDVTSFEPLGATATVKVADFRREDLVVDRADVEVALAGERLRVPRADVRAGDLELTARAVALDFDRPYFIAGVERLDLTVGRLRAYVPDLDRDASLVLRARGDADGNVVVEQFVIESTGGPPLRVTGAAQAKLPDDPAQWRSTTVNADFEGTLDGWTAKDWAFAGPVTFSGALSGDLRAPTVRAALASAGPLQVDDQTVEELTARASLTWPRLVVETLTMRAGADTVRAQGAFDWESLVLESCDYEIELPDLARTMKLLPDPLPLAGRVTGKGTLKTEGGGLTGTAGLDVTGLAYDGEALGDGTVRLVARAGVFEVEELRGGGRWGRVAATGLVDPGARRVTLRTLEVTRGELSGVLKAPLPITWDDDGGVDARGLDLAFAGGRITGGGATRGKRVEARLEGLDIELGAIDPRLRGRCTFVLAVDGDDYTLDLTAPEIEIEGYRGELFVRARQAEGGIALERLTVRAGEPLSIEGSARLPYRLVDGALVRLDDGSTQVSLDAKVRDVERYFGVPGKSVELVIRGSGEQLRVTARGEDLAPAKGVVLTGDTTVELTADKSGVAAAIRSAGNPVGEVVGEVRTSRGLDWTREADWRRLVEDGTIDGRITIAVPDLAIVRKFAPEDILALAGRMRVDLRLSGPLRAPEVTGEADVAELACKLAGDFPALRDGAGRVRFGGRAVHFEEFRVAMGYGPVGMAGSVSWAEPGAPRVDLTVVAENALLARNPYLRLRADLDLAVLGPVDALRATGKVRITDALYSKPMRLAASGPRSADTRLQLFSIRDGPLSRMRFDLAITTKDPRSFRVRNNTVRGAFQIDLLLRGTGAVPEPTGSIQFRETLAKLPFSSLKVDLGEVKFSPENPFAPRVDIRAHTRMKGYDLEVNVTGTMPDFEVYVSSRPALSQEDALLLLTTGATREQLESDGIGKTAMNKVASLVGRRLLADVSGPSDPDERSFFDRFEFEIGRSVSRSGADTIEGEFELTDRFYLRGERDRFDAYNLGVVWRLRFR